MGNLNKLRPWSTVFVLSVTVFLIVGYIQSTVDAANKVYYTCSNSNSPVASHRSDKVIPCCDGSVVEKEVTRRNLMMTLKDVTTALRVLPRGKADFLDGPDSLVEKSDCYLKSVNFLSDEIMNFPPEKNKDQVARYNQYLNDLNTAAALVVKYTKSKSQENAVRSFESMKSVCGACHFTFRP